MASPKSERRSRQRLPMRLPVSFGSPERSIETSGFTRDLSVNGIFLYTDSQIHLGSELEIVLILPPELTQGEKQWVCWRGLWSGRQDREHGDPARNPRLNPAERPFAPLYVQSFATMGTRHFWGVLHKKARNFASNAPKIVHNAGP